MKLGWIGTGDIGAPMAHRLLAAGHSVVVWARQPTRLQPLLHAGAEAGRSPRDLAARCDAVFLCVTDTEAVDSITFRTEGLASAMKSDLLIVDHSTIDAFWTQKAAQRLRKDKAGHWVDAPVSGGAMGAQRGSLTVMLGGEPADVTRARPWISAYGARLTHIGPAGSGQACKALNQSIANATIMAWAEALTCASRFGIDVRTMSAALEGGYADSLVRRDLVPRLIDGSFPGHYASIIPKDLGIATDLGRAMESPMPVTALVASLYQLHQARSDADEHAAAGLCELFGGLRPVTSRSG